MTPEERLYFVSRSGSMGDTMRPGTLPIGKSAEDSDRCWSVYKWIDRKVRSAKVIRSGYTLKCARVKAEQLNSGQETEEGVWAEGYQQGIEDAASFIQTNPHYFEGIDRDADHIAEDMRAMLLGVKPLDPADLPTMMSLWGILKDDDYSEEKETDYNPVPPKATYTAMARFKLVGRGKPLDQ